jgi:hypothetical protein
MGGGTAICLRIASVLSLLFAAGHTLGGKNSWSPMGETEVLRAMGAYAFRTQGVVRTYLDFYLGFGFILGVYLLLQAIVLWQIAGLAKPASSGIRPLLVSFLGANLLNAWLAGKFIFAIPVAFSLAIGACLAIALLPRSSASAAS